MNRILLTVLLLVATSVAWAEKKIIEVPYPPTSFDTTATRFYCTASVGTALRGRSANHSAVTQGLAKPGLSAEAHHASDKIVIEIERENLFLFGRTEFESGKSTRDFPMQLVENTKDNLFAVSTGPGRPKGAGVVTVDLKTGIATWTTIYGRGPLSDVPAIVTMYLTCGPRRD